MASTHPGIGGIKLCFGGNVFGWTLNRDQSFEILDTGHSPQVSDPEGFASLLLPFAESALAT